MRLVLSALLDHLGNLVSIHLSLGFCGVRKCRRKKLKLIDRVVLFVEKKDAGPHPEQ